MDTIPLSISPSELDMRVGTPDAPLLIDVRRRPVFDADPRMIVSATWRDPFALDDWLHYLPRHRGVVVYCVHGHEISRNACAALTAAGVAARYLAGGIEGWRSAGGATFARRADLAIPSLPGQPSRWVTRERPKIDRIACPWLIRRFLDPLAEFHYVPADRVLSFANENNAISYDAPGARFSHRGAMGERCSFDTLMEDFSIDDAALADLAVIVRGADTGHPEFSPQSAGLVAISLGLSALNGDDHAMLSQGMPVYDALYAWLRRARREVHDATLFAAAKP